MPDADVVKGKMKQAEGKAQDAVGDVTGNVDDDAAGKAKQAEGKLQEGVGKVKDAVRDAVNG